ncbi:unnamed protein product [Sphagnum balticum]
MGLVNDPSTGICSRSESGVDGGLHHALVGDEISCVMFRVALSFRLLQLYVLCLQSYCKGFTMTELQVFSASEHIECVRAQVMEKLGMALAFLGPDSASLLKTQQHLTFQMSRHLKASVLKFGSLVKGLVKVLRGLPPDEAVHEHTIAIEEQLARLREHRLAHQKEREAAALKDVKSLVDEMKCLQTNLTAVEDAAVEYVNQIGEHAQEQLEVDLKETLMTVLKQRQQVSIDVPSADPVALTAASSPCESPDESFLTSKRTETLVSTAVDLQHAEGKSSI